MYTYIPKSENPNDFRVESLNKKLKTSAYSVYISLFSGVLISEFIKCAIWVVYANMVTYIHVCCHHLHTQLCESYSLSYSLYCTHTVNIGLVVGITVGVISLLVFIGLPICIFAVVMCVSAKRRQPTIRTLVVPTPSAETTVVAPNQSATDPNPITQPLLQQVGNN